MAKKLGSDAVFIVGGTTLTHVKSATFSCGVNAVDVTTNSDGAKNYLPGDENDTFSITFHYDPIASPQAAWVFASSSWFVVKNIGTYAYRPQGSGAGLKQYSFSGVITGVSTNSQHETVLETTVDIQITGGVTVVTQ